MATETSVVPGEVQETVGDALAESRDCGALSPAALACFSEGVEQLNRGRAQEAIVSLEQALQIAPHVAEAHVALGIAFALESRIYPSLDHLEAAVELGPDNFYAHFKLGQLYFKLRVPQKGYAEMAAALGCARTVEQRKLVAQLLREESQREKNAVWRPWWHKPFTRGALFVGSTFMAVLLLLLVLHLG